MPMRYRRLLLTAALIIFSPLTAAAESPKPPAAAIASAHPLATQAGITIINQGGNAFDAAIAVTAALAVVEPAGSGLGGGGFWLLHRESDGFQTMLDGRERAPLSAHRDMYLDRKGNIIPKLSINGPLAAGIPGVPAALEHLANKYGTLPLSQNLAPAIALARNGFAIDKRYQRLINFRLRAMQQSPAAAAIFLHNNEAPDVGYIIKQLDLANTLQAIADNGAAGFYSGPVAKRLIEGTRAAGGIWTLDDLTQYKIEERTPIKSYYKNIEITSAAPPSSGGIALATMLQILENYSLDQLDNATRVHLITEAMRRAYRDRAEYLGDTDFVSVPVERLSHPFYAAGLASTIHPGKATPSSQLPGIADNRQGTDTTHFSILDRDGNRVAATLSINYPFGAAFVPPGTGVLLNDEMDDFSSKPGIPNVYGLVGNRANEIAPGKRPLSSMSPTFLEDENRVGILGTPGGSRIITMVLLGALEFAANKPPYDWVNAPRFHHQYLPDQLSFEPGIFDKKTISALKAMGHKLKARNRNYGNMQAILWDRAQNRVMAASDPRGSGQASIIE